MAARLEWLVLSNFVISFVDKQRLGLCLILHAKVLKLLLKMKFVQVPTFSFEKQNNIRSYYAQSSSISRVLNLKLPFS